MQKAIRIIIERIRKAFATRISNPPKKYICYFDASRKKKMFECAFVIIYNNTIIIQKTVSNKTRKSHKAEAWALLHLLNYVSVKIEPGSIIKIYGDALSVIAPINKSQKRGIFRLNSRVRKMKQVYNLSVEFIPRGQNTIAHLVSRGISAKEVNAVFKKRLIDGII